MLPGPASSSRAVATWRDWRVSTPSFSDKTGTLTRGTPAVMDVITYQDHITLGPSAGPRGGGGNTSAASGRGGPAQSREGAAVNVPACDETKYRLGLGVEGQVNGYYMHVGNERFMRQSDIKVRRCRIGPRCIDERGYSCLYIAVDGQLAGLVPILTKFDLKAVSSSRGCMPWGSRIRSC